jgi:hypothetical protein
VRQILGSSWTCTRCGLSNAAGSTHCASCGLAFPAAGQPAPPPSPPSSAVSATAARSVALPAAAVAPSATSTSSTNASWSLSHMFGWRAIDGTVIHVSPSRIGHLTREWWESTLRILLFAVLLITFGLVVLALSLVVLVVKLVFSVLGSFFERQNKGGVTVNTGQGFFKGLLSQLMSFFFIGKLFGPKPTIPVCDYRLRDSAGNEHHVRVEGHVVSGSLTVGDSVLVHGFDHEGTLIARGGWNQRVSSQLTVRRQ